LDTLDFTQREIVYRLGTTIERRSEETGNHVKRVAEISRLLAVAYGLESFECDIVKYASPLHDVGKIIIPEAILHKPGALDDAEWELMRSHAQVGADMLAGSKQPVIKAAAVIAGEHHEKWDGSGYPAGKSGDDIDIMARITAVADVFDAVSNTRAYKEAWPEEKVLELFRKESGKHFDPKLVDLLFENLDGIRDINERFSG